MIDRLILPELAKSKKSILLLGPRQVGKSTLIKSLKPDLTINFANEDVLLDFAGEPSALRNELDRTKARTVFIDEVQRLPSVLNTVQSIIDNEKVKFYLTGSSARKLKRGGANLLPGRVLNYQLGPITLKELSYEIDIKKELVYGFLPEVLTSNSKTENARLLMSYAANYLKEEIQAEALTRSLEAFARFLNEVSKLVGQFIDYTKISKRCRISRHSCPNYFEILEDTMLGARIFPNQDLLEKADLVKHPKFYFFDGGVLSGLRKEFSPGYETLGVLSEQAVFSQILHSSQALGKNIEISSFRTRGGLEIDFLVKLDGRYHAIEVKHSDRLISDDIAPLKMAAGYFTKYRPLVIHMGKKEQKLDSVWCLPFAKGIKEMGL